MSMWRKHNAGMSVEIDMPPDQLNRGIGGENGQSGQHGLVQTR
jgi:hypothetical protein